MDIKKIDRLEVNAELSNFYDEIINNIKKLMDNEEYDSALERINEELIQPYCPMHYYNKFYELKTEIINIKDNIKFEEQFWTKTPEELIRLVYSGNDNQKYEYWITLVQKIDFEEYDINLLKKEIINILSDEKTLISFKMSMVYDLADLGFNHKVNFYNNNLKKEIEINPYEIDDFKMQQNYVESFQILYNETFKDVTIHSFCLDVLEAVKQYYFPIYPSSDIEKFCKTIIDIVNNMIDAENNKLPNNEDAMRILEAMQDLIGK